MSEYKILDIGSGDKPIKEADILCDLYVLNNIQRSNANLVTNGRAFVQCSVENLPFQTKSIGFIYCNRVLEYASNPEKAVREMRRVGESGYFCTPSLIFPNFQGAYSKNNHIFFVTINKTMIQILPIQFRQFFILRILFTAMNLFTGVFQTEFFWSRGLDIFLKIYKSNNSELTKIPSLFVKLIVIARKKIQDLRDYILV